MNNFKNTCRTVLKYIENKSSLLSAVSSLVTIIGLPLAIAGLYFAYVQIADRLQPPEVGLLFSRPERVVFRVINASKTLAREIWYQLTFLDLDASDADGLPLDLEIKSRPFDYVGPRGSLGPYALVDLSPHAAKINKGHRLFGWASVRCSECVHSANYWVFIEQGKGGWVSGIDARGQQNLIRNLQRVFRAKGDTLSVIDDVAPKNQRTAIAPLDWDADSMGPVMRKND